MNYFYNSSPCISTRPRSVRNVFRQLMRPVLQMLLKTARITDPWARYPQDVPLARYGLGAKHAFSWYFEGESRVPVTSIEEVQEWLCGCKYVRDPVLFQECDYWQHPLTFEYLRKGDCEDFSLWAWRKLVRLGYKAEFVAGRFVLPSCSTVGHTWLVLRDLPEPLLFDPTCDTTSMLAPLSEVQQTYLPEVSVDDNLRRYAYGAYYLRQTRQH